MTQWITVKIPAEVSNQIDKLVGKYGFLSRADVTKTALRDFFKKYPETDVNGEALKNA